MNCLPPPSLLWVTVSALCVAIGVAGCKNGSATGTDAGKPKPDATKLPDAVQIAGGPAPAREVVKAMPDADFYKVTADSTGFFKYSPLQAAGSDTDLKKDTHLIMIKRGRGFSQVKTPDGQVGFVGTEDIGPLSPQELAAEHAAELQAAQAAAGGALGASVPLGTTLSGKPSTAMEPAVRLPPNAGHDERLPEPDAKPTPKNGPKVSMSPAPKASSSPAAKPSPKASPSPSPAVEFR